MSPDRVDKYRVALPGGRLTTRAIDQLHEDSTTVIAAPPTEEFSAPTTALRIQRPEPTPDTTAWNPVPPNDSATGAE
jgi:hypothetical protein